MTANMTGMQVEGATPTGAAAKRGGAHGRGIGFSGLVAAILLAVLIGGLAVHNRQASHPAAPAIPRAVTSQQTRFLENNTTNLPNAVGAAVRPVIASSEQKYLDVNTVWLPTSADATGSAMTSSQRWFQEVNTVMLPQMEAAYPDAEDVTPTIGQRR